MLGDNTTVRYALWKEGENPLVVFGINPSTANENTPDPTIRKIMGFAEYNSFDSFIMFNLYPQRATDPNKLHKELDAKRLSCLSMNIWTITSLVKDMKLEQPVILAAWGNLIDKRPYLRTCLKSIVLALNVFHPEWKCISTAKSGNPVHPLYQRYASLRPFDIMRYIFG